MRKAPKRAVLAMVPARRSQRGEREFAEVPSGVVVMVNLWKGLEITLAA
jgi:hypothetical protein